jgi:hypothetical protein
MTPGQNNPGPRPQNLFRGYWRQLEKTLGFCFQAFATGAFLMPDSPPATAPPIWLEHNTENESSVVSFQLPGTS